MRGVARACRRRPSRRSTRRRAARAACAPGPARSRPTGGRSRRRRGACAEATSRVGSTRWRAPRSCTQTSRSGQLAHERAGRAGVVEVDVRQQQRARLLVAERVEQRVDARLRAGVDEHVVDLPAADDVLAAEVVDVDWSHRQHATTYDHASPVPARPAAGVGTASCDDAHVRRALERAREVQRAPPARTRSRRGHDARLRRSHSTGRPG